MPVRVTALDHLVLRVADPEVSLAWYGRLGLAGERVEEWRAGAVPFPSVRIDPGTIIDFFARGDGADRPAGDGAVAHAGAKFDHLCLVIDPTDLDAVVRGGEFDVVRGPVDVWGARGQGRSVYVRDPDGTVVELRTYPAP